MIRDVVDSTGQHKTSCAAMKWLAIRARTLRVSHERASSCHYPTFITQDSSHFLRYRPGSTAELVDHFNSFRATSCYCITLPFPCLFFGLPL